MDARRHGLADMASLTPNEATVLAGSPHGLPVFVQRKPTEQLRRAYGLLKIEPAKFLS